MPSTPAFFLFSARVALVSASAVLTACGSEQTAPSLASDTASTGSNADPQMSGENPVTQGTQCERSWGEHEDGSITWYQLAQGTIDVNCSYGVGQGPERVNHVHTGSGRYFAAMNTVDYAEAASCGACVEVTRDGARTVIATVVDQCPSGSNSKCVRGHIDLSQEAFAQIADISEGYVGQRAGRGTISWRFVPCPTVGNVRFRLKEPDNEHWNQLIVENHRHPIRRVEVLVAGSWQVAERKNYNFWEPPNGNFGSFPAQVRVTNIEGGEFVATVAQVSGSQDSGQQFTCR